MRRVYYLTGDFANRNVAAQLAKCGDVLLTMLELRERLPSEGVLICDWDELGDEPREQVLSDASPDLLVVLHSYDLDFERQRRLVWRRQMIVYRRLESRLFAELGLAAVVAV